MNQGSLECYVCNFLANQNTRINAAEKAAWTVGSCLEGKHSNVTVGSAAVEAASPGPHPFRITSPHHVPTRTHITSPHHVSAARQARERCAVPAGPLGRRQTRSAPLALLPATEATSRVCGEGRMGRAARSLFDRISSRVERAAHTVYRNR